MSAPELRTLVLTDLVDSTALVDRIGDRKAAQIGQQFDRLSRDLLVKWRGIEIDKTDGFLLIFDRPLDAVRYGLDMHEALATLSAEQGVPISARCGIHLGEVTLRQNPPEDVARGAKPLEVEGLAKPLAARVMSLAVGGQTLLTRGAFDVAQRAATGESELEGLKWLSHGKYQLKGVSRPIEICEVGYPGKTHLKAPPSVEKAKRIEQRRTGPRLAAILGVVLATCVAVITLWFVNPWGERVEWFADVQRVNGGWVGVHPLGGPPPVVGLPAYEVKTMGGRETDIRFRPGTGVGPHEYGGGSHWHQTWNDDGRVVEVTYANASGVVLLTQSIEHRPERNEILHSFTHANGRPAPTPWTPSSNASLLETLDPQSAAATSEVELRRGTDARWGSPSRHFERDDDLKVIRVEHRDEEGNPIAGGDGWVAKVTERDDSGWSLRDRHLGFGGAPTPSKMTGCMVFSVERDELGRPTMERCEGQDGALTPFKIRGCSGVRYAYSGDEYTTTCLDGDGRPMRDVDGSMVEVRAVDDDGHVVHTTHIDDRGQPIADADGVHSAAFVFNADGNQTRHGPLLGLDGAPVWSTRHGWGWTAEYSEAGAILGRSWSGETGGVAAGPSGQAIDRFERDARGRVTSIRFYDAEQRPMMSLLPPPLYPDNLAASLVELDGREPHHRFHAHTFTYGEDSAAPVKESWEDASGDPMAVNGLGSRTYSYDEQGYMVGRQHFDLVGGPVLGPVAAYLEGAHMWCVGIDSPVDFRGVELRRTCLDAEGTPMMSGRGYASMVIDPGVTHSFEDEKGQLVVGAIGYARRTYRHNSRGEVIEKRNLDVDDGPVTSNFSGCARMTVERDVYDNPIHTCCYGPSGAPAIGLHFGSHCEATTYDAANRRLTSTHLDGDGNEVSGADGHAVQRIEWLPEGGKNRITRHFGPQPESAPVFNTHLGAHGVKSLFNEQGKLVLQERYGLDGKLLDTDRECARDVIEYDERGNQTAVIFTDANGAPCSRGGRPPAFRTQFNHRGRAVRTDDFDGEGNLLGTQIFKVDDRGNLLSKRFLGPTGEPHPRGGCAERRRQYDASGRKTSVTCLGPKGERVIGHEGWAERKLTYGVHADPISDASFGVEGEPIEVGTVHRIEIEYDRRGLRLGLRFFRSDGSPTADRGGCRRVAWKYDAAGAPVDQVCEPP